MEILNLTEDELLGINSEELVSAKSIIISETLLVTTPNGDIQTYAIPVNTSEKNFPDIPNNNGNTGYMRMKVQL